MHQGDPAGVPEAYGSRTGGPVKPRTGRMVFEKEMSPEAWEAEAAKLGLTVAEYQAGIRLTEEIVEDLLAEEAQENSQRA